jgi:NAD(P)-dependent dehydrogenase (short-subunit alcohol dehydrogenase family)
MTTSSSGLYGNFGQANYGAAKMAVVGLMNTLCLEGAKYGIRVNALAPCAATRMTEGLMNPETLNLLTVDSVTAGLLVLVSEEAPNREILTAGAGAFARTIIYETDGIYLRPEELNAENVASRWHEISDPVAQNELMQGAEQTVKFLTKAASALGIKLE